MCVSARLYVRFGLSFQCCQESQFKHGFVFVLGYVFNVVGNPSCIVVLYSFWIVFSMLLGSVVQARFCVSVGLFVNVV